MDIDYASWFADRLSLLRLEKGVSARDMSLSLGQCESYINKIENRRTMPSMSGFFYICEYLGISPAEFFDTTRHSPMRSNELLQKLEHLTPVQTEHILQIITDLTE